MMVWEMYLLLNMTIFVSMLNLWDVPVNIREIFVRCRDFGSTKKLPQSSCGLGGVNKRCDRRWSFALGRFVRN